jgi:hypothetical protein
MSVSKTGRMEGRSDFPPTQTHTGRLTGVVTIGGTNGLHDASLTFGNTQINFGEDFLLTDPGTYTFNIPLSTTVPVDPVTGEYPVAFEFRSESWGRNGTIQGSFGHTLELTSILLPNGNTPESEGWALVFDDGSVSPNLPQPVRVGGWNAARGGEAGIMSGICYYSIRDDLSSYFPAVGLRETGVLTQEFLDSIDVLLINPIYTSSNGQVSPLSAAEQSALSSWVAAGGRALVVGESGYYFAASQSMINPFGPQWSSAILGGQVTGTVTDHTSFPEITDGPFGAVNIYNGWYTGNFATVSPATSLGTWNTNGSSSLAAMNYGSGSVVFFGDNELTNGGYPEPNGPPDNDALRRNTLAYLLGLAPRNPLDYNSNGAVDAADYVLWRKTLGQSGPILAADGNLSHQIDAGDYDAWRAHFGEQGAPGRSEAFSRSNIPEPNTVALLCFLPLFFALRGRIVPSEARRW